MPFAAILTELRAKAGMTQAELAEASGVSLGSVRNLEQGIRQPSWEMVQKLASALGVSFDELAEPKAKPKKKGGQS